MADSQVFRTRFYVTNLVFVLICFVIVCVIYQLSDALSRGKIDLTAEGVYTVSETAENILGNLEDKVVVEYFVSSENLPDFFQPIKRDTRDMFQEFAALSGGRFEFKITDPAERASREAEEKVAEYYKAKEDGKEPEEPEPVQTMMDIFSGRPARKPEEIRDEREKLAVRIAKADGRDKDEVFRELLTTEFERQSLSKLEQEGIRSFPMRESKAGKVSQVNVYSAIKVSYLDKAPEIIPLHAALENLEYELMSRILKLTLDTKPVIAFFDARKPDTPPPMNPMQQRPPMSDYAYVVQSLGELFDVRETALEEEDSLDEIVASIKEDLWDEAHPDADADRKEAELDKTVKAEDFKLLRGLIVAQPDALAARQVYEINRAVSLGVPTIFVVSRFSLDASEQGLASGGPITTLAPGSAFEDMLRSWGIELPRDMLASNLCGTLRVPQREPRTGIPFIAQVPIASCVMASTNELSADDPLTSSLPQLAFPSTVGLKVVKKTQESKGLESSILAETAPETWGVKIDPFANMNNPMARGQGPSLVQYQKDLVGAKAEDFLDWTDPAPLAVRVLGKFPFEFQGKPIPEWEKKPEGDASSGPSIPGMPPGFRMPGGDGDGSPQADDPGLLAFAQEEPGAAAEPAAAEPAAAEPAAAEPAAAEPAAAEPAAAEPTAAEPAAASSDTADASATEEKKEEAPKADVTPVEGGKVLVLGSADMLKNSFLSQGREYGPNVQFFQNAVEQFSFTKDLIEIRSKQMQQRRFKPGSEDKYTFILWLNIVIVPSVVAAVGLVVFILRRARTSAYERGFRTGGRAAV